MAKWESDKGIPDTENLKAASRLLGVSIDYLLANDATEQAYALREPYDLQSFLGPKEKNITVAQLRAVDAKFPHANIIYRVGKRMPTKAEKLTDLVVLPFTPVADISPLTHSIEDLQNGTAFYLVDDRDRYYLVRLDKEYIETSEFAGSLPKKRFVAGDYLLTPGRVCRPNCKERCMNPKDTTA